MSQHPELSIVVKLASSPSYFPASLPLSTSTSLAHKTTVRASIISLLHIVEILYHYDYGYVIPRLRSPPSGPLLVYLSGSSLLFC